MILNDPHESVDFTQLDYWTPAYAALLEGVKAQIIKDDRQNGFNWSQPINITTTEHRPDDWLQAPRRLEAPTIDTPRLHLRPLRIMPYATDPTITPTLPEDDGDLMAMWHIFGREDVMKNYVDLADRFVHHTSRRPPLSTEVLERLNVRRQDFAQLLGWTIDKTKHFILNHNRSWRTQGLGGWAVDLNTEDKLVGYGGLGILDYLPTVEPSVEMSFYLHPEQQGKGFGIELARALLRWGFDNLAVDSLAACAVTTNTASIRALGKIGMVYEQTLPYTSDVSGKSAEFEVYRIKRADCQQIS